MKKIFLTMVAIISLLFATSCGSRQSQSNTQEEETTNLGFAYEENPTAEMFLGKWEYLKKDENSLVHYIYEFTSLTSATFFREEDDEIGDEYEPYKSREKVIWCFDDLSNSWRTDIAFKGADVTFTDDMSLDGFFMGKSHQEMIDVNGDVYKKIK